MVEEMKIQVSTEDILCAVELMVEDKLIGKSKFATYKFQEICSMISMGCISEEDDVLIMATEICIIALAAAYQHYPKNMLLHKPNKFTRDRLWGDKLSCIFKKMNQLGFYYPDQTPIFMTEDTKELNFPDETLDVIIAGFYDEEREIVLEARNRFYLEAGHEYEMFEVFLHMAGRAMKHNSRLLILSKPSWILKIWEILQCIYLQLEYQEYHVCMEAERHPNAYIWLRFTKQANGLNIEKQKRNVTALMEDYGIDRLYAHRNNERYPYVELTYKNTELYIHVEQNYGDMQYFFSLETTKQLAALCEERTACLVTPSVAFYAYEQKKDIVLFEMDNRFRQNKGVKFVKYDLYKGLTKLNEKRYGKQFRRIICDPPFDVPLPLLAEDIDELLIKSSSSTAYIVFPAHRKGSLVSAMALKGFVLSDSSCNLDITYGKPPKLVRIYGKNAIQLYKFVYTC